MKPAAQSRFRIPGDEEDVHDNRSDGCARPRQGDGRMTTAQAERLTGPFRGPYFILAYAIETPAGYFGYAKIFAQRPEDPWVAPALQKVGCDSSYSEAMSALAAAEQRARLAITRLGG
jgi:hypothetical protein